MATRSRIGIQLSDNSVLSVYHHWDGYPQWLGRILKTHYNTKEKVADLIDGGDMSSAWTNERWTDPESPNEFVVMCVKKPLSMVLNTIHNAVRIVLLVWMIASSSILTKTTTRSMLISGL